MVTKPKTKAAPVKRTLLTELNEFFDPAAKPRRIKVTKRKDGAHTFIAPPAITPEPVAPVAPKRRRRRRRAKAQILSQRLITEVNQKKRKFLKDISQMLTDALGFEVRVTLVRPKVPDMSPAMHKASRMTRKESRRAIAESAGGWTVPNDKIGF